MGWVGVLLLAQDVGAGALCGRCAPGVSYLLVPNMSSLRIFIHNFMLSQACPVSSMSCMGVLPGYGVAALSCATPSAL